jgi:hypothetical protein
LNQAGNSSIDGNPATTMTYTFKDSTYGPTTVYRTIAISNGNVYDFVYLARTAHFMMNFQQYN